LPYLKDNPDWYALELLDGFGSHHNCIEANELREKYRILSLKEEGDTSHVNQAYDRLTAKSDKAIAREGLQFLLKDCAFNRGIIDQWKIIPCGLAAVRKTADDKTIWSKSFEMTNTRPSKMIPFEAWCNKIAHFLQGVDSFVANNCVTIDKYTLLPPMWQALEAALKRKAVEIVEQFGGNA
jgi:hypothetical protein